MKRVIILGGGASVKEGLSKGLFDLLKSEEVWSLNSVYKAMPYLPKKQFWVDIDFFQYEVSNLQKLYEQGVPLIAKKHHRYSFLDEKITQIPTSREIDKYYGKEALQKDLLYYGRMGLCGMFALSYAIASGYTEIYLLGYDFGSTNLKEKCTHWYQTDTNIVTDCDYPDKAKIYSTGAGRPEVYLHKQEGFENKVKAEIEDFQVYTRETGISINNVSINSHINYFSKIDYDEFFRRLT